MSFLTQLTKKQLEAAAFLLPMSEFQVLIQYIAEEVTRLSLKSVRFAGEEGEKLKGACIVMQELRDNLILARETIQARAEADLAYALDQDGDPISP